MELVKMFLLTALMTAITAAYHRAERQSTRDQVGRAAPESCGVFRAPIGALIASDARTRLAHFRRSETEPR